MGDEVEAAKAKRLRFNGSEIVEAIVDSKNRCDLFRRLFDFFPTLSKEERQFPLAYAMLVHKDLVQVLMLLSTVYQPQNQFCVAVDGKADRKFWMAINELSNCYPNISVVRAQRVEWCSFEIIEAIFGCIALLANSTVDWKYVQILSGVDAPLKTNLEMVRILTALNGSFNTEISPFERYRLRRKRSKDSPLPLVKSSLSAAFSRESANFMTNSEMVRKQLDFLKGTLCADESLWGTIAGNPELLPMPGGFDAKEFLERKYGSMVANWKFVPSSPWTTPPLTSSPEDRRTAIRETYAISRYQQWVMRTNSVCRGRYSRLSCIYGVDDLPILIARPELVAHKLYMEFQPAAFLCLIREARRRSLQPSPFSSSLYRSFPDGPLRNKI